MQTIIISRDTATGVMEVATVKPDSTSSQVKKIMGENQLNLTFEDNRFLSFQINDYCLLFGELYKIQQLPVIKKLSRFLYSYTITMHAEGYDLSRAQFLFLGSDNSLRESDFSMMGTAEDFLNLVVSNANRVAPTFIKGQVIPSGWKNLSFAKENCYNALSRIAEEFKTEFWIEGKTVHLTKRTVDTGHTYKHGRNRGLYDITRQNLNDSNIVTRLYAYGSEKNLPPEYQNYSPRLRFPGGYNPCLISSLACVLTDNGNGTQTFAFTWTDPLAQGVTDVTLGYRIIGSNVPFTIVTPTGMLPQPYELIVPNGDYEFKFLTYGSTCYGYAPGHPVSTEIVPITASTTTPLLVYTPLPFVERNTDLYGVIEHTEIFEDIYPHRTGTVTSINAADPREFTDADIDFNVNSQLLPGLTAKVTFNTGQLAGYTFEIESYNDGTKKFRIQKNTDEKVLDIPSVLLKPAIGDTYVITDIKMPTSYVQAAENELLVAANTLLVQLSEPQLSYTVTIDPVFLRRYSRMLNIGDLVWIVDEELNVQRKIRVVSTTRNILNDFELQVELADIVSPGTINRILNSISTNERDVVDINGQLLNNGILNNRVAGTLVFSNMPETAVTTGFLPVYIEVATGKLFKLV